MMRRLLTRCLGLVPALVVAAAVGRAGIDALLVASQVTLSIVLPFIVFPLMYLTSSKTVMSVKKPLERSTAQGSNAEMRLISGDAGATEEQVEMVVRLGAGAVNAQTVGSEALNLVRAAYNLAVRSATYLSIGAAGTAFVCACFMEWKRLPKKSPETK